MFRSATSTAAGRSALSGNTTADENTAFGYRAGQQTTTGGQNTFAGFQAGLTNTIGIRNTAVGYQAFFVIVLLAAVPSIRATVLAPFYHPDVTKKTA